MKLSFLVSEDVLLCFGLQERQIQLIREMLMCDTSGSIQLSEEQKSALAFLNRGQPSSGNAAGKRWGTASRAALPSEVLVIRTLK